MFVIHASRNSIILFVITADRKSECINLFTNDFTGAEQANHICSRNQRWDGIISPPKIHIVGLNTENMPYETELQFTMTI